MLNFGTTFAHLHFIVSSVASNPIPSPPALGSGSRQPLIFNRSLAHEDREVCWSPRGEGSLSAFRRGRDSPRQCRPKASTGGKAKAAGARKAGGFAVCGF